MEPKTKTLLFIALAFILGGITGALMMREFGAPRFGGRGPAGNPMKEFAERLQLDARQTAQLDSLLELRRQRMEAHRKAMLDVRDTAREEIRQLLTPDQLPLFDTYLQEAAQREAKYRMDHDTSRHQGRREQ